MREINNKISYLFCGSQECINCSHLPYAPYPCCGPSSLPDYTNQNLFPTNPLYNHLLLGSESDPLTTGQKSFGFALPPPVANIEETDSASLKAYGCALMPCFNDNTVTSVCACNFNTGNVVTFKNSCEVNKHNCRFDTNFKIILNEVCPWEFESRRNNKEFEIDYNNPKYYN